MNELPEESPEAGHARRKTEAFRADVERRRREEAKKRRMFSETLVFAGLLCVAAGLVLVWPVLMDLFDGLAMIGVGPTIAFSLLCFAAGLAAIAIGGREDRR